MRTDDFPAHRDCIVQKSNAGVEWVALSLSVSDNDRNPGADSWAPYLGTYLSYTSLFIEGKMPAFGAGRDAFESQGASCYRGYLAEYPDSPVFEQSANEGYFNRGPKGMDFSEVTLSRGNEWEYDFSFTTPERPDHLHVPCQDVVKALSLAWDRQRGWVDSNGQLIAFESRKSRRSGLFIRRESLNDYLVTTKRKLVFRRFVNRGLFASGGSDGSQLDILTWLSYQPSGEPKKLQEIERPFNC